MLRPLINNAIPPLKPTDIVEYALGLLLELRVRHLPVVDNNSVLIGLVSEERLLDSSGPEARVEEQIMGDPVFATDDMHIFEATKIMVDHGLTTLPVTDEDGKYLGAIKRHDIFDLFARMLSTQESGAIIALEVEPKDFSLSKLVYLIEQNDVKILSFATENSDSNLAVRITLKLNVTDTSRVRHVLEHEGYRIVAAFSDADDSEELRDRVQEFMRYLEV